MSERHEGRSDDAPCEGEGGIEGGCVLETLLDPHNSFERQHTTTIREARGYSSTVVVNMRACELARAKAWKVLSFPFPPLV